ncbi:unnamed protein product, partial [Mycena citricolor]
LCASRPHYGRAAESSCAHTASYQQADHNESRAKAARPLPERLPGTHLRGAERAYGHDSAGGKAQDRSQGGEGGDQGAVQIVNSMAADKSCDSALVDVVIPAV